MAIGDRISLHKIGAEAVSVHQRQEDGQGHVEKARIAGQRNHWRIDVLAKRISEEALAYLQSRYEGHSSYLRGIERYPLEPERSPVRALESLPRASRKTVDVCLSRGKQRMRNSGASWILPNVIIRT